MDAELVELASTAATTLVRVLTTDGWAKAKTAMAALWRRVHPDRAATVEADLTESREELLAAGNAQDPTAEQAAVSEWKARLQRLISSDPTIAGELRAMIVDLSKALPEVDASTPGSVHMRAQASGKSRIYQAGRDMSIDDS